ncbi:hypothetical protein [Novosphingobium decolorationis]|uniref:Uncharacterized protein n=1 Tax=Novosphingobium decolorationis TaxID=2698673 RepID=A0ABX8E066_9SPHN|nr:hypothetical protein [Novosphingobium decolorationis]QVM82333.1 hypothetical protein HT578_00190 [Novosphingobium decolorationis]
MLAEVTIDSAENKAFRRSIEDMVRSQRADEAADMLRDMLTGVCSAQGPLPAEFLNTRPEAISFTGWNLLADAIWKLDQCGEPVSAVSLDLSPHTISDEDGEPVLATRFFFDTSWPFSECTREELLEGFNDYGSAWHNDHADAEERVVGIDGLGTMADALAALHMANTARETPNATALQAELLGTLYMGVLFHLAVEDKARRTALPRRMALLAVSESPFAALSTPVLANCDAPETPSAPEPYDGATGFSGTYNEDDEEEDAFENEGEDHADTMAALLSPSYSGDAQGSAPGDDPESWHLPPPGIHTTGTQLRRKLVTEESISELAESARPGLLARLFRR